MAACICFQINKFVPTPDIDDEDEYWPTPKKVIVNKAR